LAGTQTCPPLQSHIFALANIIRRPIVVFSQQQLSHAKIPLNFAGIYLPFFSPPATADRMPVFVAYLGGDGVGGSLHFVPLVCQRCHGTAPPRVRLQVMIAALSHTCTAGVLREHTCVHATSPHTAQSQGKPLPVLFPSPDWDQNEIDAQLRQCAASPPHPKCGTRRRCINIKAGT